MAGLAHDIDAETSAIRRLTSVIESPKQRDIVARCLSGTLSPAVALMQLLIETEDAAALRATIDEVTQRAASISRSSDSLLHDRVDDLTQLVVENEPGCERIAAMLRSDMDTSEMASSVDQGIAFCERLFDWSVGQSEEASVALYSLGSPQLLERATREIIAQLELWNILSQQRAILDVGCGIGRIAAEIAPRVQKVYGIDVSANMIKAATRRCAAFGNVSLHKGTGRDFGELDDESVDAAIAVDTFPYIYQSGGDLAAVHFAESRRVLKPGGDLVILNYSYRGDDRADITDVQRFAEEHDFDVVVGGERPFAIWDGLAFHLRKRST